MGEHSQRYYYQKSRIAHAPALPRQDKEWRAYSLGYYHEQMVELLKHC